MEKQTQSLKAFIKNKLFNTSKYNNESFFLNVQYLPYLLKYLHSFLSDEEIRSLVAYEMQNLILQVAAKGVDGNKSLSLQEICTYILKRIREHSFYWERYSNPWHNIQLLNNPELIHQQEKKQAQAIALYATQINLIKTNRQQKDERLFAVNRKRIVDTQYIRVNFSNPDKIYEKIDHILFGKLKQYALQKFPTLEEMKLQYFIFDVCLCTQQRRKRKRNQLVDEQKQQTVFDEFKTMLLKNEIQLLDLLTDEPKQLQIIENIIKSFQLLLKQIQTQQHSNKQVNIEEKFEEKLDQKEHQSLVIQWLKHYSFLNPSLKQINKPTTFYDNTINGCLGSFEEIQLLAENWNKMFQCQSIQKANKYKYNLGEKINWTEAQYKLFLQGLITYFHLSVNNKKIAAHMGKSIQPNHVKYIKGQYLRNMKLRRGNQSKIQFIKNDLQNFHLKLFEKSKVVKTRRTRKWKRKNDNNLEDDSSY